MSGKSVFLTVALSGILMSQALFPQKVVRLYDGKAPGTESWTQKEIQWESAPFSGKMIRNVTDPTLEVYQPTTPVANGTAVVVCPGGGYIWLSYSSEGTEVAQWLAQKGITAFVLKYRLNPTPEDPAEFQKFTMEFFKKLMAIMNPDPNAPTSTAATVTFDPAGADGVAAVQYVRQHAGEYGIDPKKVGIMGFSAGAGVTVYTILHSTPENQPNFAAPIYGGWLGDSKVPESAPPLFILAAADDGISNGLPDLYKAWRQAGKSAELHMYSKGGHGFGMAKKGLPVDGWIERLWEWMVVSGF
jgi:acetyl esterase/lipase